MKKIIYPAVFFVAFVFAWMLAGDVQRDALSIASDETQESGSTVAQGSEEKIETSSKWVPPFARDTALSKVAKKSTVEERQAYEEQMDKLRKELEEREREEEKKEQKKEKKKLEPTGTYIEKNVPSGNEVKKFERYTLLTQWKQAELQTLAHTDKNGMRKVGERYCVALGSYYTTEIGTKLDLVMAGGNVIPCVLGDVKSDMHTDSLHQRGRNGGCVAEFIVDDDKLPTEARTRGSVHWIPEFAGEIRSIRIYTD